MTSTKSDLEGKYVLERDVWADGPPHELFRQMRERVPGPLVARGMTEFPEEAGFWSVTRPDDIHAVSRDFKTYSSELGGVTVMNSGFPIEYSRAMFIGMDPPKHDRLKMLFQSGFTPKRIAAHEDADPRDHVHACSTASRVARAATSWPTSPSRPFRA